MIVDNEPTTIDGSWPGANYCWFRAKEAPTLVGSSPGPNKNCWFLAKNQQGLVLGLEPKQMLVLGLEQTTIVGS